MTLREFVQAGGSNPQDHAFRRIVQAALARLSDDLAHRGETPTDRAFALSAAEGRILHAYLDSK